MDGINKLTSGLLPICLALCLASSAAKAESPMRLRFLEMVLSKTPTTTASPATRSIKPANKTSVRRRSALRPIDEVPEFELAQVDKRSTSISDSVSGFRYGIAPEEVEQMLEINQQPAARQSFRIRNIARKYGFDLMRLSSDD